MVHVRLRSNFFSYCPEERRIKRKISLLEFCRMCGFPNKNAMSPRVRIPLNHSFARPRRNAHKCLFFFFGGNRPFKRPLVITVIETSKKLPKSLWGGKDPLQDDIAVAGSSSRFPCLNFEAWIFGLRRRRRRTSGNPAAPPDERLK